MGRHLVEHQPGYLLHRYPYRESSLLVDMFTRGHGRLMLVAKGSRRGKSKARGHFIPFKPLLVSWSGRGSLPTLTAVEAGRNFPDMDRLGRNCGYYANELLMRLLHRQDSHESLFDRYEDMLAALARGDDPSRVLRIFEKHLLQETGFGLILDRDVETGEQIREYERYSYIPQKGPVLSALPGHLVVSGKALMTLREELPMTPDVKRESRLLTRMLIDVQLNGKELRTRKVAISMKQLQDSQIPHAADEPPDSR